MEYQFTHVIEKLGTPNHIEVKLTSKQNAGFFISLHRRMSPDSIFLVREVKPTDDLSNVPTVETFAQHRRPTEPLPSY